MEVIELHDPGARRAPTDAPATSQYCCSTSPINQQHIQQPIQHCFTVDTEDWAQGLLHGETPITGRVVHNVERILNLLQRFGVRATFFVLGKAIEKYPVITEMIAAQGHEIASHGYGHELVFKLSPQQFRTDLSRSIELIGEQTGRAPLGYRAPAFSITLKSLWAVPLLIEMGFRYSSSIFPFAGRRYGIAEAPRYPFRWSEWWKTLHDIAPTTNDEQRTTCLGGELWEFPLTTLAVGNRRIPVAGGGYLRLLPVWFLMQAFRQAERAKQPAVIYMHPYELDTNEVREWLQAGLPISRLTAFKQSLFRGRVANRLAAILQHFRFAPMAEVLRVAAGKSSLNP
ncbi:MAG: hypothetical protein HJJLKODD_02319 [Phycisphaerae bacterium]|nr:hypothetical protein [Phycisphaerae bacterium]